MKTNVKMNCPSCKVEINVDELLVSQFQESIRKDLQEELQNREKELTQHRAEIKRQSLELEKEKQELESSVQSKVREQVLAKEEAIKASIRQQINEEKSMQLQELENELVKKSSQLKELNGTKAQLQRLQRELEETETRIILQKEQELTERLEQARAGIHEQIQQESFLKLKEKEKTIESLRLKLDEAKRQAEQGSQQAQGEVFELFIEQTLKEMFPTDSIDEVGKGVCGADCIQTVRTQNGAIIGKVIYEVKNTARFNTSFISKLKQDNQVAKADIMVIVTKTMPAEIKGKFGLIDNVWVCSKDSISELALALRFGLLKLQAVAITQQGKESKMELLYSYLTSDDFKNTFESILTGFKTLQDSHASEKLKIQRLWKEREKVLEKILTNSIDFYGSVKAIAGAAIAEIPMLSDTQKAA